MIILGLSRAQFLVQPQTHGIGLDKKLGIACETGNSPIVTWWETVVLGCFVLWIDLRHLAAILTMKERNLPLSFLQSTRVWSGSRMPKGHVAAHGRNLPVPTRNPLLCLANLGYSAESISNPIYIYIHSIICSQSWKEHFWILFCRDISSIHLNYLMNSWLNPQLFNHLDG